MSKNIAFSYTSPLGSIFLVEKNEALTHASFGTSQVVGAVWQETDFLKEVASQLKEYFDGHRSVFDFKLAPEGTDFRRTCWQALLEIPFGELRTYGQQAQKIGNPKAARAVGQANHHNPISIIIPCHRVVGAGGSLGGYASGLDHKKYLLTLEGSWPMV